MRKSIIAFLLTLFLLPSMLLAQEMNIVELDFDGNFPWFLYHYEPKFNEDFGIMGQIFGFHSPDFPDEMGYTVGIYYSTPSFLIEFPAGMLFSMSSELTGVKTKINWFWGSPTFKAPKWEAQMINDMAWGVRGHPNQLFNKLEFMYLPHIDAGLRIQSFNVDNEPFAPYIGVIKRVRFGNTQFFVYQGKNLRHGDWRIELNVYIFHFPK